MLVHRHIQLHENNVLLAQLPFLYSAAELKAFRIIEVCALRNTERTEELCIEYWNDFGFSEIRTQQAKSTTISRKPVLDIHALYVLR